MEKARFDVLLTLIGYNIRRIRTSNGFTMEVLANLAGIEYRQLGKIERGEANSTVKTLHRIAEALGVGIAEIFTAAPLNTEKF